MCPRFLLAGLRASHSGAASQLPQPWGCTFWQLSLCGWRGGGHRHGWSFPVPSWQSFCSCCSQLRSAPDVSSFFSHSPCGKAQYANRQFSYFQLGEVAAASLPAVPRAGSLAAPAAAIAKCTGRKKFALDPCQSTTLLWFARLPADTFLNNMAPAKQSRLRTSASAHLRGTCLGVVAAAHSCQRHTLAAQLVT